MKNKMLTVVLASVAVLGACAAVVGCGPAYTPSYSFDEYDRNLPQPNATATTERATLDGKFDEDFWKSANWHDMTSREANCDGDDVNLVGFPDIAYKATIVTDAKGFYIGLQSDDPVLYVGRKWDDFELNANQVPSSAFAKTGFSLYIADANESRGAAEIGFSIDGDMVMNNYWHDGSVTRHGISDIAAGVDTKGVALNSENAQGYNVEAFVPWSSVPVFDETTTPVSVKATFASHRYASVDLDSVEARVRRWELLDNAHGQGWLNEGAWLEYGANGVERQRQGESFGSLYNGDLYPYDSGYDLSGDDGTENAKVVFSPSKVVGTHSVLYVNDMQDTRMFAEFTLKPNGADRFEADRWPMMGMAFNGEPVTIGRETHSQAAHFGIALDCGDPSAPRLADGYYSAPLDGKDFTDNRKFINMNGLFDPFDRNGFKLGAYRDGEEFSFFCNGVLVAKTAFDYITADTETYLSLFVRSIGVEISDYEFYTGDEAADRAAEISDSAQMKLGSDMTVDIDGGDVAANEGFTVSATVNAGQGDQMPQRPGFGVTVGGKTYRIIVGTWGSAANWPQVRVVYDNYDKIYFVGFDPQIALPADEDYNIKITLYDGRLNAEVNGISRTFAKDDFEAFGDPDNFTLDDLFDDTKPKTVGLATSLHHAVFKNISFDKNAEALDKIVNTYTVELDRESERIAAGKTTRLIATATKNGADASTSSKIVWSSSDESVAAVDANGNVTGIKKGTATITARLGHVKAECTVTVIGAEIDFVIDGDGIESVGADYALNLAVNIPNGNSAFIGSSALDITVKVNDEAIPGATIDWTNGNDDVAAIVGNTITARGLGATEFVGSYTEGGETVSFTVYVTVVNVVTGHISYADTLPHAGDTVTVICGDVDANADGEGNYAIGLSGGAHTLTFESDYYVSVSETVDVGAAAIVRNVSFATLKANTSLPLDNGAVDRDQGFVIEANMTSTDWGYGQPGFSVKVGDRTYTFVGRTADGRWHNFRIYYDGGFANYETVVNRDEGALSLDGYRVKLAYKDGMFVETMGGKSTLLTYDMFVSGLAVNGGNKSLFLEFPEGYDALAGLKDLFDASKPKTVGIGTARGVSSYSNVTFTTDADTVASAVNSYSLRPNAAVGFVDVEADRGFVIEANVTATDWNGGQPGFSVKVGDRTYTIVGRTADGRWHNFRIYYDGGFANFETRANRDEGALSLNGYKVKLAYKDGVFVETMGGKSTLLNYDMFVSGLTASGGNKSLFLEFPEGYDALAGLKDLFDASKPKTVGIGTASGENTFSSVAFTTDADTVASAVNAYTLGFDSNAGLAKVEANTGFSLSVTVNVGNGGEMWDRPGFSVTVGDKTYKVIVGAWGIAENWPQVRVVYDNYDRLYYADFPPKVTLPANTDYEIKITVRNGNLTAELAGATQTFTKSDFKMLDAPDNYTLDDLFDDTKPKTVGVATSKVSDAEFKNFTVTTV